jgi:large subunit ribosomal protein L22
MPGLKTNERPGTRAVLRHSRMSAFKAREVLDLIRGVDFARATEILDSSSRGAAPVVAKLLRSAAANAEHNDQFDSDELFVSSCYADEGTTLKRWRPRARGRATRIRKRTCHITVILSRMPEEELARRRARLLAEQAANRQRRVAGARRARRRGQETAADIAASDTEEQTEAVEAATERALESAGGVEAVEGTEEEAADETSAGAAPAEDGEEESAGAQSAAGESEQGAAGEGASEETIAAGIDEDDEESEEEKD